MNKGQQPSFVKEETLAEDLAETHSFEETKPDPDAVSIREFSEGVHKVTFTKPATLFIGDKQYSVSNWQDVLLNNIQHLDDIGSLPSAPFPSSGRGLVYVKKTGKMLAPTLVIRRNREQIFVETHSSTISKIQKIEKLLEAQTGNDNSPESVYVKLQE